MRQIFILTLIMLTTSLAPAQASEGLERSIEEFRTYLQNYRKENKIPSLSVAIVKGDDIVFAEGFGWQDHDGEEPTTADTTYLVASISKTFTGATLLAMEADGHIDLDTDFTTLSDWERRCKWLTSGVTIFGGGKTLDNGYEIPKLNCAGPISLRHVLQHRVQGEPGTSFFYNPIVFGRLSNWVEENTDRSFRDWMEKYVLKPAKLKNIAAGWRHPGRGQALTQLAPPFRHDPEDDDGISPSPLPNPELNASSGIIASVLDLAAYSIALDEGKILSPELREKMWTPPAEPNGEPAPYAYGWRVQEWKGRRLVWHGGWWPDAYAGLLLKAPDDGWALIALGNTDGLHWEGDTLTQSKVEESPLAAKFLETFVEEN